MVVSTVDEVWQKLGVCHGFFSRAGGVSEGIYASLNCGLSSGDKQENVRSNLLRVQQSMKLQHLITLRQIHGDTVLTVDEDFLRTFSTGERPEGDAMVTKLYGVGLGILTADCAPVLLIDRQNSVVGAAHAGWKGALGGVLGAVIAAMEKLGGERANISAVVGPCIGGKSYEVSSEFPENFCYSEAKNIRFFSYDQVGKVYFHFEEYVLHRLQTERISSARGKGVDTYPEKAGYFSNRRRVHRDEHDYGRQISLIAL